MDSSAVRATEALAETARASIYVRPGPGLDLRCWWCLHTAKDDRHPMSCPALPVLSAIHAFDHESIAGGKDVAARADDLYNAVNEYVRPSELAGACRICLGTTEHRPECRMQLLWHSMKLYQEHAHPPDPLDVLLKAGDDLKTEVMAMIYSRRDAKLCDGCGRMKGEGHYQGDPDRREHFPCKYIKLAAAADQWERSRAAAITSE